MDKPAFTITVDMDKTCKGCGKKGATQCGYCLKCVGDLMAERAARQSNRRKL